LCGPTCGLHWPNLLHENPDRNSEIVDAWVELKKPYDEKTETLLAPNSDDFHHQLVHHRFTKIKVEDSYIKLDFSDLNRLQSPVGQNDFVLKIENPKEILFEPKNILIESESINKIYKNLQYTLRLKRILGKKEARLVYRDK
ncbi:MAG: hypothetical protein KAR20_15350, partial [Candidatus Heimdallarchaeota archaeon]|nr:hypothetical protein [Candidatus Heimdallarchaeota archaeon]